jgi:hypothetical protein
MHKFSQCFSCCHHTITVSHTLVLSYNATYFSPWFKAIIQFERNFVSEINIFIRYLKNQNQTFIYFSSVQDFFPPRFFGLTHTYTNSTCKNLINSFILHNYICKKSDLLEIRNHNYILLTHFGQVLPVCNKSHFIESHFPQLCQYYNLCVQCISPEVLISYPFLM